MGVDLSTTIIAKSDQLNADDLIGGPIDILITRVAGMNDKEQPIAIYYDGDNGKPYKPGKSMRRVLVNFWGKQGDDYVGKWLRLFRDPEVSFGGIKVGGIRIAAMSHIRGDGEMALAVTRGAKRRFEVKALTPPQAGGGGNGAAPKRTPAEMVDAYIAAINDEEVIANVDELRDYQLDERRAKWIETLRKKYPTEHARVIEANSARHAELAGDLDDDEDGEEGGGPDAGEGDPVDGGEAAQDDDDDFPGDA